MSIRVLATFKKRFRAGVSGSGTRHAEARKSFILFQLVSMFSVLRASTTRTASSNSGHYIAKGVARKVDHGTSSRRTSICVGLVDDRPPLSGSSSRPAAAHSMARRNAATAAVASTRQRPSSASTVYLDDAEDFRRSSSSHRAPSSYPPPPKSFSRISADPAPILEHLQELFPGLDFPPELAVQMFTHASAKEAWAASNNRLSYVGALYLCCVISSFFTYRLPVLDWVFPSLRTGRRVMSTYLLLFLHHATTRLSSSSSSHLVSPSSSQFDFDAINYRATYTALIGERVGRAWDLPRSLLWTPPVSNSTSSIEDRVGNASRSWAPGLYKVQGTTVEAIIGGIYHQFVRTFYFALFLRSFFFFLFFFLPFASFPP